VRWREVHAHVQRRPSLLPDHLRRDRGGLRVWSGRRDLRQSLPAMPGWAALLCQGLRSGRRPRHGRRREL